MSISTQNSRFFVLVVIALLLTAGPTHGQSTSDQSLKSIPQQVKANAENKATAKSYDVSNAAMTKLDSASNRAFRKFTGLFKRKDHPVTGRSNPDSTGVRRKDSIVQTIPAS